jgi:hypothetical protein
MDLRPLPYDTLQIEKPACLAPVGGVAYAGAPPLTVDESRSTSTRLGALL